MRGRWLLGLMAALGMWLLVGPDVPEATAQVTAVTFGIPQESGIVPPAGDDPGDKIIFVGREDAVVDGTGCGGTAGNVIQSVVLVDPFLGRSGRLSGVLVVSQIGPVRPGTKLKLPVRQTGDCAVNGIIYEKYTGQVE